MIILAVLCLSFFSCSEAKLPPQTEYVFGTVCTVNMFDDGTAELYADVFSTLKNLDDKFSVNKNDSEISRVNQNAGVSKVEISSDVFELLKLSKLIAGKTDCAFNPVLGALIQLWGIGTERQAVPDSAKIERAKKHCNPDSLVLTEDGGAFFAELTDGETQIDLGGIVKGFAADEVVKILSQKNVQKAVVDLGGNIYVFGQKDKDKNRKWRIGIKNPDGETTEPVKIVSVDSGSVVTSGNYERFFISDGIRYHHIIDGRTGFPAESGFSSVSVVYEKSVFCDALSTAYFVGGEKADFVQNLGLKDVQLIFVKNDGTVIEQSY